MSSGSDDFNRADSSNISTSAPQPWTEVKGDFEINTNRLHLNSTDGSEDNYARVDFDLDTVDHECSVTIVGITNTSANFQVFGPCVRFAGAATTCYYLDLYTAEASPATAVGAEVWKVEAGTQTQVANLGDFGGITNGDVFKLRVFGSQIRVYQNGNLIGSTSDSSITTGKRVGVFAGRRTGTDHYFDQIDYADYTEPIALAFDAVSNSAQGTGNLSWTHTPVGTPKGILVLVVQNAGATDEVTSVTYGGVTMNEVSGSPVLHTTGAEDGALYGYFLGGGIPTGAQTVQVNVNATGSQKRCVAVSILGPGDLLVLTTQTLDSGGVANPSVTLAVPANREAWCAAALHSGQNNPTSVTPAGDCTELHEFDFGNQVANWERLTTNTTGGNTAMAWTATSEEAGVLAVAIGVEFPVHNVFVLPGYPAQLASRW